MGRSVFIDFPRPTLEELGKSLGMSKKRQRAIIEIVREDRAVHPRSKARAGKPAKSAEIKQKEASVSRAK